MFANATRVIPESEDTIVSNFWGPPSLLATDGRLLIEYQTGGPSEIRVFDRAGNPLPSPDLPPVSSIGQMVETDDGVLFSVGSFTQQTAWKRLDPRTGTVTDTALRSDVGGKVIEDFLHHRPWFACPDHPAIDAAHRADHVARRRLEGFIGREQLVEREGPFLDLPLVLPG